MGLSAEHIQTSLDAIAAGDVQFKKALDMAGYPEPRLRDRGYTTLLRTIVGQQVSVAAANSMWNKLAAKLGEECAPEKLLAEDFDSLRACGLSRQKQGYARSLAELVISGAPKLKGLAVGRRKYTCCLPKGVAIFGLPVI
jgi:DNA-3-methyladenine glycosylase II